MRHLREIVAKASTVEERVHGPFSPVPSGARSNLIDTRLEAWCQAVARGDWTRFRQRLAWDGLDLDSVRPVLDTVRLRDEARLPDWAETLAEGVALAAALDKASGDALAAARAFLDPAMPIPFEDVLAPFVLLARTRLESNTQSDTVHGLLGQEAHAALERHLLRELSHFAAEALMLEFAVLRHRTLSPWQRLLARAEDSEERTLYDRFARRMRKGGLAAFFREYATLGRALATVVDGWVGANTDFLGRLRADWPLLQHGFGKDEPLSTVVSLQPAMSDPHHGRRTVHALKFASGLRLIYKPKGIGMEAAYFRLLAWMNPRGAPLPFRVLSVLDGGDHGWVEQVEREPCRDPEEVRRYYRRAGMLLCLVYALRGTDCHHENLIPSGEHPVLVDLETLVQPHVRLDARAEGPGALLAASELIGDSVVYTGLLPYFELDPEDGIVSDRSGLGGEDEREGYVHHWKGVNTDRMEMEYKRHKSPTPPMGPMFDGIPQRVDGYIDELTEGFEEMYRFLVKQRAALLEPASPLYALADKPVRFIFRASSVYGSLFTKLRLPKYLRDGADHGIQLELLGRALMPAEDTAGEASRRPQFWAVFGAERQAMQQRDVPLFTTSAASDSLTVAPGRTVESCFEAGFDHVVERLNALGEEDLEQQLTLIQGTLHSHTARQPASTRAAPPGTGASERREARPFTPDELVAAAADIGDHLGRHAIRAPDGSATWIGLHYISRVERYRLQPMAYELYSGGCGVGLFLATLARITGDRDARELALGAVQPLLHEARAHGDRGLRNAGIGGAAGISSAVYALVRMSRFLGEPTLVEEARQMATFMTPERIASDTRLDVIGGAAGAILGLLALHEAAGEGLEQAVDCGRHLVNARRTTESGHRAWPTLQGKPLTGFAHGAAGIAYALLRLYEIVPDPVFLAAAEEGIAYENTLFSAEAGNWPDLRAEAQPAFMASWCQGAPGIGLARLGGLQVFDTPRIRLDIEIALQTTQTTEQPDVDHLCCGHLGRAEVLVTAAGRLSRPRLLETARSHANWVVKRARARGGLRLASAPPGRVYSPSCFQGTSGIGYELLRMARPELVPSMLLWE